MAVPPPGLPDLDSPARIDAFVDAFYDRVFRDPLLAPLFLDVAAVEPRRHLAQIKAYWRKMLLGDPRYRRNMVQRHRDVDRRAPFTDAHYARWLLLFETTLEGYRGPAAARAAHLARRIAGNLRRNLEQFRVQT